MKGWLPHRLTQTLCRAHQGASRAVTQLQPLAQVEWRRVLGRQKEGAGWAQL